MQRPTGVPTDRTTTPLVTAVQFLTRLPVGATPHPPAPLGQAAGWFPLVGVVVGGMAAAVHAGAWALWAPPVAAVLAVAVAVATTGAFHEDGLADSFDGLWGGWTPERRLEIMRDSRLGTYGAAALVLSLLLRVTLLSVLPPVDAVRALLLGHVVGRATVLPLVARYPAARSEGQGARMVGPSGPVTWLIAGVTVVIVGVVTLGFWLPLALVAAYTVAGRMATISQKKVGGLTGDVLGAANMLAHLAVMLTGAALAGLGALDGAVWNGLW